MNLTILAGFLLAVTMATARRPSLGERTTRAAGKADEADEAMRAAAEPASLVEKIMRAADEMEGPGTGLGQRVARGQKMYKRRKEFKPWYLPKGYGSGCNKQCQEWNNQTPAPTCNCGNCNRYQVIRGCSSAQCNACECEAENCYGKCPKPKWESRCR